MIKFLKYIFFIALIIFLYILNFFNYQCYYLESEDSISKKFGKFVDWCAFKYEQHFLPESVTGESISDEQYMKALKEKILRNWRPLAFDKKKNLKVRFMIDKKGNLIGGPEVLESSRNKEVDEAALDAVRQSAPFGELPKELNQDTFSIIFTFYQKDYK